MSINALKVSANNNSQRPLNEYEVSVTEGILSIKTHYETRFLEQGMTINYLAFRLEKNKSVCYGWEKAE
jgi:hypothetical protein